jgi:hypothetical protein
MVAYAKARDRRRAHHFRRAAVEGLQVAGGDHAGFVGAVFEAEGAVTPVLKPKALTAPLIFSVLGTFAFRLSGWLKRHPRVGTGS